MISKERIRHMVSVAEYMHDNAYKYKLNPEEMYIVGLLHDIGYLFGREQHEQSGADILSQMGFSSLYTEPIAAHNKPANEEMSPDQEDIHKLLVEADLMVDHLGNTAGIEQRLLGIENRYGKAEEYDACVRLAEWLNLI